MSLQQLSCSHHMLFQSHIQLICLYVLKTMDVLWKNMPLTRKVHREKEAIDQYFHEEYKVNKTIFMHK